MRDDAVGNGGSAEDLVADADTGYPDNCQYEQDGYYEGEYDEDEGLQQDGYEVQDDSSEDLEPATPVGKASRPMGKGKARRKHQTKARAKASLGSKRNPGLRLPKSWQHTRPSQKD